MENEQIKQYLDQELNSSDPVTHVCEIDKIRIADIEKIEKQPYHFEDRTVVRFLLTVKGQPKKVLCPMSVMIQLKELQKQEEVIAFRVLKSGVGIRTSYTLVPELKQL